MIEVADGAILPGVGAFYDAMQEISHLKEIIRSLGDKPFLGICLGLQLLFTESEEGGRNPGLNVIPGDVVRFKGNIKVPHMGWNRVKIVKKTPLLDGISNGSYFYFVHSYFGVPDDKFVTGVTTYGINFPSVIESGNVLATQFHPEKSGDNGLKLLDNFIGLVRHNL
jgi:glutamine amidotransferase